MSFCAPFSCNIMQAHVELFKGGKLQDQTACEAHEFNINFPVFDNCFIARNSLNLGPL